MAKAPNHAPPATARPRQGTRPVWVAVRLIAVLGLGILACIVYSVVSDPFGSDEQDLPITQLESLAHFTLPPGAANVRSHKTGFEDSVVTATFTMPAEQMGPFLQSTLCASNSATTHPELESPLEGQHESWWHPGSPAKSFRATSEGGGRGQGILVDQTNPAVYTVWIRTWER